MLTWAHGGDPIDEFGQQAVVVAMLATMLVSALLKARVCYLVIPHG
jgi:hypothetical protein